MSDGYAEKVLAGLLGVGDEILEINNMAVQKLSLDTVYEVMAQSQLMLLKTLPFLARRDFWCQKLILITRLKTIFKNGAASNRILIGYRLLFR